MRFTPQRMANEFIIPKICLVSAKKYWPVGLIFVNFDFDQKSDMKAVSLEPSGTKKSFQWKKFFRIMTWSFGERWQNISSEAH